jgi:2-C-methyl-D-erythritol 4-phosphate cytidylyltransferase
MVLYTKDLNRITEFGKERLGLTFETWKEDVKDKVLVFIDEAGDFVVKDYVTRFTSEKKTKELIWRYNVAWDITTLFFDTAVFVTITQPPIMTLREIQYAQTFIIRRLKEYLRKYYESQILFSDEAEYLLKRFKEKEVREMIVLMTLNKMRELKTLPHI